MAQFDISGSVDPLLSVTLNKGESLFAESNAMVAMDGTLSLSGRTKGGFFKSLARKFLNDETFFQQKITAEDEGGRARASRKFRGPFCNGNRRRRPCGRKRLRKRPSH